MIRENLDWIIVMLKYPGAGVEVRNHRYYSTYRIIFPIRLTFNI